jgi:hypothetical protein
MMSSCNEHEGRQRAGFKCRVFIAKGHRRRQVAGSRGRQQVTGVQKANNTGREKASGSLQGEPLLQGLRASDVTD